MASEKYYFDIKYAQRAYRIGEFWRISPFSSKHYIRVETILDIFSRTPEELEIEDYGSGYKLIEDGDKIIKSYKGFIIFNNYGIYGAEIDIKEFISNDTSGKFDNVDFKKNFVSYKDFKPIREYLDVEAINRLRRKQGLNLVPLPDISSVKDVYYDMLDIAQNRHDDRMSVIRLG